MSRLLAADIVTPGAHPFEHVAIADGGAHERDSVRLQISLKAEVRHHRRDQAAAAKSPAAVPGGGDQGHELVAVDDRARLVHDDQPVGIAIERNADIGAGFDHRPAQQAGIGRSATLVDVEAVGLDPDRDHVRAKLPQGRRRDLVGGAVGAIDNDFEPVESHLGWERRLRGVDVAAARILDPLRPADRLGWDKQRLGLEQRLDRGLVLIGKLVAIGPEQFDAVVGELVVAGRDHHADVGAHRVGQHRHRRCRDRADHHHVHADAGESGDERRFHHVAGQAGVLADDDPVPVAPAKEVRAGGLADLERHLGGHRHLVGAAPDPVRAEEFARHDHAQ